MFILTIKAKNKIPMMLLSLAVASAVDGPLRNFVIKD